MNMVGVTTNFYDLTLERIANTTEVAMQFCLYGRMYEWRTVFRAEYDMDIIFYE